MPGVYRPTTLIDVLSTLNQGTLPPTQTTNTNISQGIFAEDDETIPLADSMTTTVQAPATWDSGVWGGTVWS